MICYLSLGEVLNLHSQIIKQSGGSVVVRDLAALESAIAQPRMTFISDNYTTRPIISS